ncbi:MAG: methylated-DNA--[protein]-cysteine S-methyltransferase [Oscillospiraceae bacterium]|jgi:methylated-DNA-[protein]-cysteine S-methyltransferase|nr:methylated-DNA--[protein]-cysteine S-methyltransferase [Oscillospiraceae bacterium]
MTTCFTHEFPQPIGELTVYMTDKAITGVAFGKADAMVPQDMDRFGFVAQMDEYLQGTRREFDLPLSLETVKSEFMLRVYENMQKFPYGETATYGTLAAMSGNALAARAVGMACNRNPIAIVIPCHRIVGKNGSLVGYGGGLHVKRYLLELERS